ncbi:hypothetical protein LTR62_003942 [Meristemomyces frigidus]|uniref:Uncharacterized protein n=1 Tax=Meristemomyces frigidus TaxID=1508187 RepID=A0AAN7TEZ9_9PEZI|nr:hypothetical protein LTR62_003942 [Meristemomyces frigidus]
MAVAKELMNHRDGSKRRYKPTTSKKEAKAAQMKLHNVFRSENLHVRQDCDTIMMPAFQLASRLLWAEPFLDFWHTVFFSSITETPSPKGSKPDTRHFIYSASPPHLTRDQIRQTHQALDLLSSCVVFELNSSPPRSGGGRCKHLRSTPATPPFQGHKSEIQISSYFYNTLSNSAVSAQDKMWLQFELAKTLLHELAHAAVNAARGRASNHFYFFPGEKVAEDGFQLEAFLFGGAITLHREDFQAELRKVKEKKKNGGERGGEVVAPLIEGFRRPWPCREVVEEYEERGSCIGVRGTVLGHGGREGVRFRNVERLFSERFWEEDGGAFGGLGMV